MRSYGRGFITAVDPYAQNAPDEDGDVLCAGCGGVFPGLDALRAAGLLAYPERCRECRAAERARVDAPFVDAPTTWGGLAKRRRNAGSGR